MHLSTPSQALEIVTVTRKLSNKRSRGLILTFKGWKKLQSAIRAESEDMHKQDLTLEELSDRTCLSPHTISRIQGRLEAVDKSSLQSAFAAFTLELCECDYTRPHSQFNDLEAQRATPEYDWGEAPDVSVFYGRSMELLQLQQWVLEERCRLVTLLGIGGIGKSTLAVKLGLQVQSDFEVVVWRSLQNAPTVEENLTSILQFLLWALRKEVVIPQTEDGKLSKLMECLINHRCLLILDDAETILSNNGQTGKCRPGYEGYGQLLKRIGEVSHNSCILVTSREKLREIALLEGERTKVKTLPLKGLNPIEGRELFQQKGQFTGTKQQWQSLIEYYGGNPYILKMIATTTLELFDGRIGSFLEYVEQGMQFEDISNLLEPQFNRLSVVEQEVMYTLAINREPMSLADLATSIQKPQLLQAVKSLLQRSLIEKSGKQFFLQPVMMEYVMQRLSVKSESCKKLIVSPMISQIYQEVKVVFWD